MEALSYCVKSLIEADIWAHNHCGPGENARALNDAARQSFEEQQHVCHYAADKRPKNSFNG